MDVWIPGILSLIAWCAGASANDAAHVAAEVLRATRAANAGDAGDAGDAALHALQDKTQLQKTVEDVKSARLRCLSWIFCLDIHAEAQDCLFHILHSSKLYTWASARGEHRKAPK